MTVPLDYQKYCLESCGRLVNHDDEIPTDQLIKSFKYTQKKWKEEFKESYTGIGQVNRQICTIRMFLFLFVLIFVVLVLIFHFVYYVEDAYITFIVFACKRK